jgi:8-oxo-dGTP pyrophosphatase MutT (NUDIX family)
MKETIRAALQARARVALPPGAGYPAAVLLLLYAQGGDYHIILTARTATVEHHKSEVSFPGGGRDPGDSDLLATALRETWEEIGVRPEDVEILGALDDLLTITRFAVTPYVGVIPYPYPFRPNPNEVEQILEIPLHHLLDVANQIETERDRAGVRVRMPAFRFGQYEIWGATERMLRQFLQLVFPEFAASASAVGEAIRLESAPIEPQSAD